MDEETLFEMQRDIAEYNALFFNADGVKEARKHRDSLKEVDDFSSEFNPEAEMERIRNNPIIDKLKEKYSSNTNSSGNYETKINNIMDIT